MKCGIKLLRSNRWRLVVTAGIALPAFWLVSALIFVYVMTRRPHARFEEPVPSVAWGNLEPHTLRTKDGETLGAWLHRGSDTGASVILLHGNRGCRGDTLPLAGFFANQGCSVLLVSLRCHGDSTGRVNDFGYSARGDVIAAVEFMDKERRERRIVVNGISMGAAAAIFASRDLGERVSGYVLESPYRDLYQAVRNRTAMYLPPVLDQLAYTGMVVVGPLVLPQADRIAPIDCIADIPATVPVLLLSGTKDRRALPSEAQALCARIAGHGRLALFEGVGHGSLIRDDPERYSEALTPWLHEVVRKASQPAWHQRKSI